MKSKPEKFQITKKILIEVIKNNGDCNETVIGCMDISERCCQNCVINKRQLIEVAGTKRRYEAAVNLFIERYGKEKLFEVLL